MSEKDLRIVDLKKVRRVTVKDIDTKHDVSYYISSQDLLDCPKATATTTAENYISTLWEAILKEVYVEKSDLPCGIMINSNDLMRVLKENPIPMEVKDD